MYVRVPEDLGAGQVSRTAAHVAAAAGTLAEDSLLAEDSAVAETLGEAAAGSPGAVRRAGHHGSLRDASCRVSHRGCL